MNNQPISKIIKNTDTLNCKINCIKISDLFKKYEEYGFIYPEKKLLLKPYWETIQKNWELSCKANTLRIITSENPETKGWASFSSWQTTTNGFINQHLVSSQDPALIKAVLLGTHSRELLEKENYNSFQHFFVPSHNQPNKIFGTVQHDMDKSVFDLRSINFIKVNPKLIQSQDFPVEIKNCTNKDNNELYQFIAQNHSEVFAKAEELDKNDINLDALNSKYQEVGLSLKRSIKTAYLSNSTEPIGAIISYHGSLGLSFNFLENRCILILDASLSDKEKYFVTCSLINSIVDLYADFPLGYIPVLTDDSAAKSLILQGHPLDRKFRHLICLRNGFVQWYQHIIHIFSS
jgi:hypothetical protein